MRPLHTLLLAAAPLLAPLHGGHLYLLTESVLGVVAGATVVGLYLLALRWSGGRDDQRSGRERRSNRESRSDR